jgi:hypothetical protein
MNDDNGVKLVACVVIFVILLMCAGICGCVGDNWSPEEITGEVESAFIKRWDEHDRYLVTVKKSDGQVETFQIRDTIFDGVDFRSADHFGQLKVGTRVTAKAAGWRVPALSGFRRLSHIKTAK